MKKIFYILLLICVGLLAACQGSTIVEQAPADFDLSELPAVIDVTTAATLQNRDDVLFIDVREQHEYDEQHIPGITLIPMNEVPNRLDEIPKDKTVIVTCRSGNRSGQITQYLQKNGYNNVHNMDGGIVAWQAAGYAVEK